jgi:flagellar protein FliS
MDPTPRDSYLETQINTATPQQLRLMLIEGAIRHGRQTIELWAQRRTDEALESLIRCRGMIGELLAGVKDDGSALSKQVKDIYLFLFTALTESQMTRDATRLGAALRVLEEERSTWQAVCRQLPGAPPAAHFDAMHAGMATVGISSGGSFSIDA